MSDLRMENGVGWRWFGYDGHLVVGKRCAFHLATIVGDVFISTVGHYIPRGAEEMEEIGIGRTFETFVLRLGKDKVDKNGDPDVIEFEAIDSESYNDSVSAERGHYEVCWRWDARQKH